MCKGRMEQKTSIEKHLKSVKNTIPIPNSLEGGECGEKYKNFILFTDISYAKPTISDQITGKSGVCASLPKT